MNKKYNFIVGLAIALVLLLLLMFYNNGKHVGKVEQKVVYDTIYASSVETISIEKPIPYFVHVHDTIYREMQVVGDTSDVLVEIPISQAYYHEDSLYDAWVSGYEPRLDSIHVIAKNKETIINKTITNVVYQKKYKLYGDIGFLMAHDGRFYPQVGVSIATPKKWLVGAKIGLYEQKPMYSLSIGYNILK